MNDVTVIVDGKKISAAEFAGPRYAGIHLDDAADMFPFAMRSGRIFYAQGRTENGRVPRSRTKAARK